MSAKHKRCSHDIGMYQSKVFKGRTLCYAWSSGESLPATRDVLMELLVEEECVSHPIRWQLHCASGDIAPYYRPSPPPAPPGYYYYGAHRHRLCDISTASAPSTISPTHYGMHQLPPPRNLDDDEFNGGNEKRRVRHVPILAV